MRVWYFCLSVCLLLYFEDGRYSASVRVGQTGVQGTEWASDTSVMCKVAAGVEGSVRVVVTSGEESGTGTDAASYDGGAVSTLRAANEGTTGGGSMTVSGASFGTRR